MSLDSSDNSDDDFQTPTAAKRRHLSELKTVIEDTPSSIGDHVDQVLNNVVSVDIQADDIRDLKRSMENEGRETRSATKLATQQVKAASSLPLPLLDKLQTDLQCSVFKEVPHRQPVIDSTCCSSIVGCESCITTWYEGLGIGRPKPWPKRGTNNGGMHAKLFSDRRIGRAHPDYPIVRQPRTA